MVSLTPNVGVAFALVCFAGLCAPLGASVVLAIKLGQRKLLAASIALAAGVMIFVSMTEVLNESEMEVTAFGFSEPVVLLVVYGSFLGGMLACWLLDALTDVLLLLVVKSPGAVTKKRRPSGRLRDIPITELTAQKAGNAGKESPKDADIEASMPEPTSGSVHTAGHLAPEEPLYQATNEMDNAKDFAVLMRTGVLITLALSLHNLPEGLATFK